MRLWTVGLIALTLLAVSGCGQEEESGADRLAGEALSNADEKRLGEWSEGFDPALTSQAELNRAFKAEDIEAARTAVDKFNEAIRKQSNRTTEFDGNKIRTILQDYLGPIRRLGAALERLVVAAEEQKAGASTTDATVNARVKDVQEADERNRVNKDRFTKRLLEVASPEQRERIRADQKKTQEAFDEQSAPAP